MRGEFMIRRLIQWTVSAPANASRWTNDPLYPAEQIRYAVIRQIREGNAVVLAENGGRSPERGQVGCGECPRKLDKSVNSAWISTHPGFPGGTRSMSRGRSFKGEKGGQEKQGDK